MIVTRELMTDVLTASRQRIQNIFSNDKPVYLSFSGGKDSIVLAHITIELGRAGKIDLHRLRVEFIDEEAIFPCVERTVMEWRERFLLLGARFDWYCLEVCHYSCLNQLENDESFICWDRTKSDSWVRQPPHFAIRSHPLLRPRVDSYQQFLERISDGPHMTGVRMFESIQRRSSLARKYGSYTRCKTEPIYDWYDSDVWYYLKKNDIAIPEAYLHLYQIGVQNQRLRISQFFSIDTAFTLSRLNEFYPALMDSILRREPNAYIVSLYWDSEMFRRRTGARKQIGEVETNYREKVLSLLSDVEQNFKSKIMKETAIEIKRLLIRCSGHMSEKTFKQTYDVLLAGDPKRRTIRALFTRIFHDSARLNGTRKIEPISAGDGR